MKFISNNKILLGESELHKIISEAILDMLTEIASAKIYHFTSISNVLKMAEENTIYLQSALAGTANKSNSPNRLFYLSTTRTKYQSFGYSRKFSNNSARIEFDGNKINQILHSKPYNYWGYSMGKSTYLQNDNDGFTVSKQEHTRDEAEDRLYSSKSAIQGIYNYITRIDIIINDFSEENFTNYINAKNLLFTPFARKIFIYDNLKDFNAQSNNIINDKIDQDYESYGKAAYRRRNEMFLSNVSIKIVLAAILSGETDNPNRDSANLLKQYGLDSYIKKGLMKNSNEYFNYSYKELAYKLSYELEDLSRKPSSDKSKLLQMISDYFKKNKLNTYIDYVNYKEMKTASDKNYGLITRLVEKGVIDDKKEINVWLIKNTDTYDYVIVDDPYKIRITDINKDVENIAYYFINYTEENMKSSSYNSYEKYIKRIFSKNPTLGDIINMLNKLGYNDNMTDILERILDTRIKEQTLNCYSLGYDMVMPQCINDKKRNLSYFLELFKKN